MSKITNDVEHIYQNINWDQLKKAGFHKEGDYHFIFTYPPNRALENICEKDVFDDPIYEQKNTTNLYIHIPYCKSICTYCYFTKILDNEGCQVSKDEYVELLKIEFQNTIEKYNERVEISTVHIGGGTPYLLSEKNFSDIIQMISPYLKDNTEITVECSPGSILTESGKLSFLRELGVNRLSVGVEALDDNLLRIMNRKYSKNDVLKALDITMNTYDNINVDLIYGVPSQSMLTWEKTLTETVKLGLHSVSTYRLRFHPRKQISKIDRGLPTTEELYKMQLLHGVVLASGGYIRSSTHKYALGKQNVQKQPELIRGLNSAQLLGIGCGAYGFINETIYWNYRNIGAYLHKVSKNIHPCWKGAKLNEDDLYRKTLIQSLYTSSGLSKNDFFKKYNVDIVEYFESELKALVNNNLITIDENLKLTELGHLFADDIAIFLYSSEVKEVLNSQGFRYGMFWEDIDGMGTRNK